jgi:L-2-hydroxyglutarate oxidase LhgO
MDHFHRETRRRCNADPLVLGTDVTDIEQKNDGYVVKINSGEDAFSVMSRIVINSAGLHADKIAEMVGRMVEEYL